MATTAAGGSPVSSLVTNTGVLVTNGLFTTMVDLGTNNFNANPWLELRVRPAGSNAFTVLSPRQAMSPVPMAVTAINLAGGINFGQLPAGLLTNYQVGPVMFTNYQNQLSGIINAAGGNVVTNGSVFLTPSQFGAIGDATTDDTLAISNAFAALNTGPVRVLDFQGRTYAIHASPPSISVPRVEIRNGAILYTGKSGYVIGHNTGFQTSEFWVHDMKIWRWGFTEAPDPDCFGINLHADGGIGYYDDVKIERCEIFNFFNDIEGGPTAGIKIELCRLLGCWSNAIHFPANVNDPDMVMIHLCDFDQANSPIAPLPVQYLNTTAIQFDVGCHGLYIEGCNIGTVKQAFNNRTGALLNEGVRVHVENVNSGMFRMTDPKVCPWEFWDSTVYMRGVEIDPPGSFGATSNYLNQVGLYSLTNNGTPQGLRLADQEFHGVATLDMWDASGAYNGGLPNMVSAGGVWVTTHTTFGDAGTQKYYGVATVPHFGGNNNWYGYNTFNNDVNFNNNLYLGRNTSYATAYNLLGYTGAGQAMGLIGYTEDPGSS
ncbi:MAG TPA: hypothetical protein VF607_07305, partial [Verrucomicrobiae bacterium]